MEAILSHPSTPRHLLERFAKDRNLLGNAINGQQERLVLKRLSEEPVGVPSP